MLTFYLTACVCKMPIWNTRHGDAQDRTLAGFTEAMSKGQQNKQRPAEDMEESEDLDVFTVIQ